MIERVTNINEAFLYILDCNLATVGNMAMLKSKSKSEYRRQIRIAQRMIGWIKDFHIEPNKGDRAFDIINNYSGNVTKWAEHFKNA